MKFHELNLTARKDKKRVGRGISAGGGKTAGRGTKGQKSRSGHSRMPSPFMGGQKAMMQAIPKLRGFKSIHAKAEIVYTDALNSLSGSVDNAVLAENALISSPFVSAKIISRGELTAKINLKTQFASASAVAAIKKAGGSFTKTPVPSRPANPKKTARTAKK